MFSNYLTIAIRNLYKRKFISFVNAFGLSISIAFCLLIFLFINDERSFDRFHKNASSIFRLEENSYNQWVDSDEITFKKSAYLQTPLIPVIKEEIPQVRYGTRYNQNDECIVQSGQTAFEETVTFVDADFFHIFSFELLQGNIDHVFDDPYSAVITPALAQKVFNRTDVLDESIDLTINGKTENYRITGIIQAHPSNSSITYDILIPQTQRPFYENNMERWNSFNSPSFVMLEDGASLEAFQANLNSLEEKYLAENINQWKVNSGLPDDMDPFSYEFTNIRDVHLNTEVEWQLRSDPQYSYILGGIGLLILIIACINYISLSRSTAVSRQTEVGVRKAVGAHQKQLFIQFTIESILLASISMLIGLVIVTLFLPNFNEFTNKVIKLDFSLFTQVFLMSVLISVAVGFLSGVYPAIFLSSYRPVRVLKSNKTSRLKAGFTIPLVLIQFCLSAMLIICSLVMFRQMKFITTKDLGYNADQIIVIPTQMGFSEESDRAVAKLRQAISGEPEFLGIAGTTMSFNRGWSRYGYTIDEEEKFAYVYGVDYEYLPLLDIEFAEGRNFDENNPADSNAIIVNEALVRDMGWDNPLQEYLNWQEDSLGQGDRIIGVAKDYHFLSLENDIHPMFLSINTQRIGHLTEIMVKLQAGNIPQGIEKLRDKWQRVIPDKPFTYTFLDDNVASQYESYQRWMKIMGLATFFAIMISCLGLFGLSGINAVNRTKEIGIRKVMEAGT